MKIFHKLIIITLLFGANTVSAQIERPVIWSYLAKKTNKTEAVIYLKANIDQGWHIYSQNVKEGGPVKTSFKFYPSKDFSLVGRTMEPKAIVKYEPTFKMNVNYFENKVTFQQKIKLNKAVSVIKVKVEFMVCNDRQCLPPDEQEFSIPVK